MKLQDAIASIHSPKGLSSVLAGLMSGDLKPIKGQDGIGATLESARAKLQEAQAAQQDCGSDWAYWGYAGDIAYWTCLISLLEAAALCGPDNLPEVEPPKLKGVVVMDAQASLVEWGAEVLARAKAMHRLRCSRCGKTVSTPVPAATIVRAWVECPECVASQPDGKDER